MTTTGYSNNAARLPSLPTVSVGDASLQRFLNAVRENIEVRAGARGDRFERAVTLRDLVQLGLVDERSGSGPSARLLSGGGGTPSSQSNGGVVVQTGTRYTTLDFEQFASTIVNSKLFRSITAGLSDASRFDMMSERVRQALLKDLAAEAKQRGADVRRVEEKIQTATESTAIAMQEVTASLGAAVAGVRETAFSTATETKATAGVVTQVTAALGDPSTFLGAGVTLEQAMFGIADASEGLYGQYTVKMNAAGHAAGFGLAIEATGDNDATSAFVIAADKFAIVAATETLADPLNPPADRIPFGVDTVEDVIYINGNVRIGNATGVPISDITPGADGDSVIVEWSVNGSTSWHSTFVSGDKYARWKIGTGGAWQGPFQVVGENGANGNYTSFVFKRAASLPATPTGSTPSGWFDAPPAADGNPLWASLGTKTSAGALVGSWSTPVQIEGAAGAPGSAGTRGSRTWYEPANGAYTASYTFGGNSAGAASYAAKATSIISTDGAGSPMKGDTVIFTNGSNYTYTIVHNGSAWVAPGVIIDGNLLVTGSITTTHLSSSVSISTSGYLYAAGAAAYTITDVSGSSGSGTASVFANATMGSKFGVVGYTATSNGAGVHGYNANGTNGPGVSGRGILGVHGAATSDSGAGGYFQSYSGGGRAIEAIGYVHATGYIKSDYYIETPDIILGQTPTTGSGTATFPGNNKPGGSTTCGWLAFQTNSGIRYVPCWA